MIPFSYVVEIALATMGAALKQHQRAEAGLIPNIRVFESNYKLEWMNDPWQDVAAAGEWLLKLGDEFRPETVRLFAASHSKGASCG